MAVRDRLERRWNIVEKVSLLSDDTIREKSARQLFLQWQEVAEQGGIRGCPVMREEPAAYFQRTGWPYQFAALIRGGNASEDLASVHNGGNPGVVV